MRGEYILGSHQIVIYSLHLVNIFFMLNFIKYFIEIVQWIKIMLSPFMIGVLSALAVYYNYPNKYGALIGFCLCFLGLVVGVAWATLIWKKYGTNNFMSRIIATPELDGFKKDGTKVEDTETNEIPK